MLYVYTHIHKEQILVYHHRVSANVRFMMASFSENMCIYDILSFFFHIHTYIFWKEAWLFSNFKKANLSSSYFFLLSATAVGQMVKLEMFVVVMRLFPFDQDATSIKHIQWHARLVTRFFFFSLSFSFREKNIHLFTIGGII